MRQIGSFTLLTMIVLVLPPASVAREQEEAPTAWLGVTLGSVEPGAETDTVEGPGISLTEPPGDSPVLAARGARITGVVNDSPAARYGMRAGDIVLAVDGRPVNSPSDLIGAVGSLDPGRWVELQIVRRGDERSLSVRLAERPTIGRQLDVRRGWAGLTLVDVPRQLQEAWGGEGGVGVLVGAVEPGSPAEIAGVFAGDLVLWIDGHPVQGAFELLPLLRGGGVGNEVVLGLSRQGTLLDVSVELIAEPPREGRGKRDLRRRSNWRKQRDSNTTVFENFIPSDQIVIIEDPRDGSPVRIIEDSSEAPPSDDAPDGER